MGRRKVKSINKTLKFTGIASGIFTSIQAVIWLILTLTGFICFFADPGSGDTAVAFHETYMDLSAEDSPGVAVKPLGFLILVIVYFILTAAWLHASQNLISVFSKWNNVNNIKQASRLWLAVTFLICIIDLIVFIVFLIDFIQMGKTDSRKVRASDMDSSIARLFTQNYAKIMTQEYFNETKAKLDELYRKKFSGETDQPAADADGDAEPEAEAEAKGKAKPKPEKAPEPQAKPSDKKFVEVDFKGESLGENPNHMRWARGGDQGGGRADENNQDVSNKSAVVQERGKRSIESVVTASMQQVWATGAWAYSYVPNMPIPNFIRNLIGNPCQYLIDSIHYGLFGNKTNYVTTTPATIIVPDMRVYNPRMPPAILMTVALRGFIIWIANCCLLAFMYSLLTKLRVEMNGIFGCFLDLCKSKKANKRRGSRGMY